MSTFRLYEGPELSFAIMFQRDLHYVLPALPWGYNLYAILHELVTREADMTDVVVADYRLLSVVADKRSVK